MKITYFQSGVYRTTCINNGVAWVGTHLNISHKMVIILILLVRFVTDCQQKYVGLLST